LGTPDRFIWFDKNASVHDSVGLDTKQHSFYSVEETGSGVVLPPNTSLVVAPWVAPPSTAGLSLDLSDKNVMLAGTHPTNSVESVVNVSEPLEGYSGTPGSTASPFDSSSTVLAQHGTIACYKTICLQRLADPNRKYDPICNPYLTVDWSMIDLQAINSKDPDNAEGLTADTSGKYFSSRQWKTETGTANIWDRTLKATDLKDKAGLESNAANAPKHTFGEPNYSTPLMHFPWNDAPLMNTGELMLVPSSAPGRFSVEFHDNGTGKKFFDKQNRFGYYHDESKSAFSTYFNWSYTNKDDAGSSTELYMVRLLDFVYVPTRFSGTREETPGGSSGRTYKEPGKINLNTVSEEGWKALQNGRAQFPDYSILVNLRNNPDEPHQSPVATLLGLEAMMNNDADNPYVALENVMRLSDVTTMRSNVFAIWITVGYFNVKKVDTLTKLTEEYPEHNFDHIKDDDMFRAVYPDGYGLGAELGLDDASVKRHRTFYLIDRSNLLDPNSTPTVRFKRGTKLTDDEKKRVVIKETVLD
jgi:hypothetical protein